MQITSNIVGIDHGLATPSDIATAASVTDQEQDERMDAFLKACAETFGQTSTEAKDSEPRHVSSSHMHISDSEMRMLRQMFDERFARLQARMQQQLDRAASAIQARVADLSTSSVERGNATPKTSVRAE